MKFIDEKTTKIVLKYMLYEIKKEKYLKNIFLNSK